MRAHIVRTPRGQVAEHGRTPAVAARMRPAVLLVITVRGVAIEIGASASSSRFLFRRGKSGEPAADFYKRFLPKFSSALRAGHYTV